MGPGPGWTLLWEWGLGPFPPGRLITQTALFMFTCLRMCHLSYTGMPTPKGGARLWKGAQQGLQCPQGWPGLEWGSSHLCHHDL